MLSLIRLQWQHASISIYLPERTDSPSSLTMPGCPFPGQEQKVPLRLPCVSGSIADLSSASDGHFLSLDMFVLTGGLL